MKKWLILAVTCFTCTAVFAQDDDGAAQVEVSRDSDVANNSEAAANVDSSTDADE